MSASLEIYPRKQPKQKLFKFNKDTGKLISSQARFPDVGLSRWGGSNENGGLDTELPRLYAHSWMQLCGCAWFHFRVMLGKLNLCLFFTDSCPVCAPHSAEKPKLLLKAD